MDDYELFLKVYTEADCSDVDDTKSIRSDIIKHFGMLKIEPNNENVNKVLSNLPVKLLGQYDNDTFYELYKIVVEVFEIKND